MNIQKRPMMSGSQFLQNQKSSLPTERPVPEGTEVTFDAQTDCYHYKGDGYSREVCRANPLADGAMVAAAVAVPSAIGAITKAAVGTAAAFALNVAVGPGIGAVLGAAYIGMGAWEETNQNILFTGLATIVGATAGAVAFPLLQLPGTIGGVVGTLAAAGIAGTGVGLYEMNGNKEVDEEARAAGYAPKQETNR